MASRSDAVERRRCQTPKQNGDPCTAPPLMGLDVCLAHAPEPTKRELGFGGAQPGAGRPRASRPSEVIERLVADNAAVVVRPHFRALGYDVATSDDGTLKLVPLKTGGAKLAATFQGVVSVSQVDDLKAQMDAAERLIDRAWGRPTQNTELSGADGGAITLASLALMAMDEPSEAD